MNKQYSKGDRLKITTEEALLTPGWSETVSHYGHIITVDYEMDSYVSGVCSCDLRIYPYKDQVEQINKVTLEDPSGALLKIELSISQINELERHLASKLADGVDTLSKLLSDVARILEPKVKK
jgi:hypothetical protein